MVGVSMPSPAPQRLLILLSAVNFCILIAAGLGFRCTADGMTCTALVRYIPQNTTTIGDIASQFQLLAYTDLLAPNSRPSDTPPGQTVPSGQTVRVPVPCLCQDGTGASYKRPVYFVKDLDYLVYIATFVFSQLVDYKSIVAVNRIRDPNFIVVNQRMWIPLPCSCDRVDGREVTHYAIVVQEGNNLSSIASEYNTTAAVLVKLNNLSNPNSLLAGQVLDVPLPPGAANPPIPAGNVYRPPGATNPPNPSGNLSRSPGAAHPPIPAGGGTKTIRLRIILPVALVAILTAAAGIYSCWKWRDSPKDSAFEQLQLGEGRKDGRGSELPLFRLRVIMDATNGFSESNLLGQGGFGSVYKGKLIGEQEVAVKRLSRNSKQGSEEFMNEVKLIARLQHKNLVQLLGCCIERQERILIYEYMPNKSLDTFLFDATLSKQLDWEKRFEIVMGMAQGLQYLHRESRLKVVHRDLKASNILLDGLMIPRISDFGLARIFDGDQTQVNTNRVVGTYGYMSPEYALEGRYSTKSDVFSFGVIILEMVSGKKMTSFHDEECFLNLLGYAWKLWNEDRGLDFLDPLLGRSCHLGQVLRCVNVGLLCVQDAAADRPAMSSVVFMLSSDSATLAEPKPPAYSYRGRFPAMSSDSANSNPKICSSNEVTVSVLEAR